MTPKKTTKTKAPVLLWNERGQIGCTIPGHAPHKGSDTWKFERWNRIPDGAAKEDGAPYRCETCSAAEHSAAAEPAADETSAAPVEAEPAGDGASTADSPAEPKKKGRKTKADLTLADLADRYVTHLEESGKSSGTAASYGLEMKTALAELGAETKLADLTPEQVLAYFASRRVTRKKSGKHKSPLSIAKTQRVLRLALVWAVERKLIEKAPLPETLATH